MKILLANPPCRIEVNKDWERYFVRSGSRWPFSILKRKIQKPDYVPFPFYLAYAASLLEQAGFDVEVLDAVALNLTREDFLNRVKEINPALILFETFTPTIDYDLELAKSLKTITESIIVLTGTHATVFPEEVMSRGNIDYIITGEYELSLLNLVKAIHCKAGPQILKEIKGLVFREQNAVIRNNRQELIEPLDRIPAPSLHLFPSNQDNDLSCYWDAFCQYKPAIQLHSSRGCPFRCNFCLWNQVMYGNGKYRVFSAERVVNEIQYAMQKFKAREVYFDDDTFTVDKNHVLQICREIEKRRLNIKWSCMADAICSDSEMINAMADSGCIGIKFGAESGDEEILNRIEKPLDYDKLRQLLKTCSQKNIKTHVTFTFGLLGETPETMNKTLRLAQSLDADSVQFSITTPFPGTRFYNTLKEKNMLISANWSDFDGAGKSVVKYEGLTASQIEGFCRRAGKIWLRYKLRDFKWLLRQAYNLNRVRIGQGYKGLFNKFCSFLRLIK